MEGHAQWLENLERHYFPNKSASEYDNLNAREEEREEGMNAVEPIRDKDDIQAMKDYLRSWNERNYILFLVGINTGFRIGDILKLRVKDVQGWHIRVREQKLVNRKLLK